MNRDLQRMELPDRFSDITGSPVSIAAAANPVLINSSGVIVGTRADKTSRVRAQVVWNSSAKLAAYKSRYDKALSRTVANQGAECLYMIMSTSFVAGSPAIASIPANNIGDTDEDGLPEILDAWGRPLGFIRWPVGFDDPEGSIDPGDLSDSTKPGIPDDFDPFRADFAYFSTVANATDINTTKTTKPWSFRPLVVSAGQDGEFGIALDPYTSSSSSPEDAYSYNASTYNSTDAASTDAVAFFGTDESVGRTGIYNFPDPYLRRFKALNASALFPGQALPASDQSENRGDNITNYSLQASP